MDLLTDAFPCGNGRESFFRLLTPVLLLTGFFLSGPTGVLAQSDPDLRIRGQVLTTGGEAVEFATVMLINPVDGALLTGTTTDSEGRFDLETAPGDYRLEVRFLGMLPTVLDRVQASGADVDLGTIILREDRQLLEEVVVSTERS
ncbi:MAG: carboxypeptidase regulatory-like domain-containing protein, partial [Saprospiraceae bacterium]|nr:carboxypeptidase regulatory-like domain-containing protein [Saprospiraceae bacterium]